MFSRFFALFKPTKAALTSRELLKQATQLKKEKKYDEACEKLNEAFVADGHENLMTKEFLRLPMYLQLAGKNDDGWRALNEMNIKFIDIYSQSDIANQMRIFLQKEKKFKLAIQFTVWSICKNIEIYRSNIKNSENFADEMAELDEEFLLDDESELNIQVVGKTRKENPITDQSYLSFKEGISYLQSLDGVTDILKGNIKKAKLSDVEKDICQAIFDYLNNQKKYQLRQVRDILDSCINST